MNKRWAFGSLLTIAALIAAVVLGVYVLVAAAAGYKRSSVRRGWASSFGTREEILARYPSTDANASALELERLTARLGIDTAPRHLQERARPDAVPSTEVKRSISATTAYRTAQIGKTERGIDPPPDDALGFLRAHQPEIEAIRRHLTAGEVPRWELRVDRPHATPVPNLIGHIDLQKLIVLDALVHAREGRREVALEDLEASWTLTRALADHPVLIVQLIAISETRMILGVLRQVPDAPAQWRERLRGHDFRERFLTALRFEAWGVTQIGGAAGDLANLEPWTAVLGARFARPYIDLCLAHTSDSLRVRIDRLARVEALCDYDLAAGGADLDVRVPAWNLFGGLLVPQLSGSLDRLASLELDLELTARILDLERARAASGSWPTTLPGGTASLACSEDRFVYEVTPDGAARLALDREISWPILRETRLPPSFTLPDSLRGQVFTSFTTGTTSLGGTVRELNQAGTGGREFLN